MKLNPIVHVERAKLGRAHGSGRPRGSWDASISIPLSMHASSYWSVCRDNGYFSSKGILTLYDLEM